jgi:hypothetical protein
MIKPVAVIARSGRGIRRFVFFGRGTATQPVTRKGKEQVQPKKEQANKKGYIITPEYIGYFHSFIRMVSSCCLPSACVQIVS